MSRELIYSTVSLEKALTRQGVSFTHDTESCEAKSCFCEQDGWYDCECPRQTYTTNFVVPDLAFQREAFGWEGDRPLAFSGVTSCKALPRVAEWFLDNVQGAWVSY